MSSFSFLKQWEKYDKEEQETEVNVLKYCFDRGEKKKRNTHGGRLGCTWEKKVKETKPCWDLIYIYL